MKVLLIAWLILLLGCSPVFNNDKEGFPKKVTLKGEVIELFSNDEFLLDPIRIFLIDSLLLVHNGPFEDRIFSIIDIKNNKILKHFSPIGEGYNEFIHGKIGDINKSKSPRCFEFYDSSTLELVEANIDSILNDSPRSYQAVLRLDKNVEDTESEEFSLPFKVCKINDSLFVTRDFYKDGRYGLVNNDAKVLGVFFPYPDNDENEFDPKIKLTIFQNLMSAHPQKKLFVSAFFTSDWLEICEVDDNEIKMIYSHYTFLPKYRQQSKINLVGERKIKIGYNRLAVNKNNIYVQKSDRTVEQSVVGNRIVFESSEVFAYDWEGNALFHYLLDKEVQNIAVDDENEFLYAIVNSEEPQIVRYRLPSALD